MATTVWMKSFVALARTQHYGRAAAEIFISTAALSQQIQRLERDLGVQLFNRTSRTVQITAEGLELLPMAESLVEADARIESWKKAIAERSDAFQIGFVSIGAPAFVTRLLSLFGSDGLEIRIRHLAQRDIIPAVNSGEIDAAFVWGPIHDVIGHHVLADRAPRVVLLPAGHRLAGRSSLSLSEIDGERILRSDLLNDEAQKWWAIDPRPSGRPVDYGPRSVDLEEALALVAMGNGLYMTINWIGQYFSHFGVTAVPINDVPDVPMHVCLRPGDETARMTRFRAVLDSASARE